MELGYYFFEVKFYDEETYELCEERGIICAESFSEVVEKLHWYFGRSINDIHVWYVEMDTNEFLFEKNFPGLMDLISRPVE